MDNKSLLIKNVNIVSPGDGPDRRGDIYIEKGIIKLIDTGVNPESVSPDTDVIEGEGLYAAPGFVDVHTHFRDPGQTEKEDIHSGAGAAAAGGYTTVVCMANTVPAVDNADTLKYVQDKAAKEAVHILQCGSITKGREGKELNDLKALQEAGAAGFTDDGSPITDEELVIKAMEEASRLGMILSFHEEDPEFIGMAGINEGEVAEEMGLKGADRKAEITMVKRDLALALETGCTIDIQHVSAAETVELIREAKKKDSKNLIHAEATPNHFSMTEEAVRKYGSLAKINPPLRTEEDRLAIIEGLKDGTIDMIATDHAPHTDADKAKSFSQCMSGIIGLETAFSLGLKYLVEPGHIALRKLVGLMSLNPAEVYGLDAGHIRAGSPGDIVIFDTKGSTKFKSFKSRAENSPFLGDTLPGRIVHVIAGGSKIF